MATVDPAEFEREHWGHGFPWCDTCKRPAVFSEWRGPSHSTPEHPFGLPKSLDDSGHEVTMRGWWAS